MAMNMHSPIGLDSAEAVEDAGAVRRRRMIVGAVVVAAVLAALFFAFGRGKKDAVPAAPELATVTVVVPGSTLVADQVRVTGSVAARREMPVGVQGEGGMVTAVLVEPGISVRSGQVLARIDRSVQSQQVAQLQAGVARAHADAQLAQSQLDRAQTLVGKGFISKADIDTRTAARDGARAAERLAQAQLRESQARLGRLDIRAPSDGLVMARNIEVGQIVGPATPPLFKIAQHGQMELRAAIAEQDLAKLRVGQPVTMTVVGSGHQVRGRIWLLEPMIDMTSRQGMARILLDRDKEVRAGGFANALISSGSTTKPVLPQSAVQADDKGSYVLIAGPDGKVARRDVVVGTITATGLSIARGLTGAERVVATAGAFLQPGEKINPVVARN